MRMSAIRARLRRSKPPCVWVVAMSVGPSSRRPGGFKPPHVWVVAMRAARYVQEAVQATRNLGGYPQGRHLCRCRPWLLPSTSHRSLPIPPLYPPRRKFLLCSHFGSLFHRRPSHWNLTISFIYQQKFQFPLAISRPMATKYRGVLHHTRPRDWGTPSITGRIS
jgi:hypothetical protein